MAALIAQAVSAPGPPRGCHRPLPG
jgi:hypothetical protein